MKKIKVSKEANEKAEYLRQMLEAMTGKKIVFKTVKGEPVELVKDKSKEELCKPCQELCPAFGGKPSACAKNIKVMKELDKKSRRKRK